MYDPHKYHNFTIAHTRITIHLGTVSLPGHELCYEGDDADCLWVLQEGDMVALRHAQRISLLPAPCLLGEHVLLADIVPQCRYDMHAGCVSWCHWTIVLFAGPCQ